VNSSNNDIFSLAGEVMIPQAPPDFKSGFIGIVGRPNVGKSTLMNQLVGQNSHYIASSPNYTQSIAGYLNHKRGTINFCGYTRNS